MKRRYWGGDPRDPEYPFDEPYDCDEWDIDNHEELMQELYERGER